MNYYNWNDIIIWCLIALLFYIVLGAFGGWIFMLLWNWLAPLFWISAPELTFLQAWGVIVLLSWIESFFRSKSK